MQEINLLQNKVKDQTLSWERRNRFFLTLLTLVLILEILGGVGLYILTKTTMNDTQSVLQSNQDIQNAINSNQKDLANARGLQAQLKNIQLLLTNHIYWTSFLKNLYAATTKKTQYTGISAGTDGKVHLLGTAPTYTDIGKLILSLSTTENITSVKLTTVTPAEGKVFGYSFALDLKISSKLFTK